jgi:negative regulator of replication initiation
MRQLTVSDAIYEQLALLARAWGISASDVVERLLRDFRGTEAEAASAKSQEVAVHAIYAGVRTDGTYDRASQSLTITTGPLAGKTFSKPSGAAVALVAALRPGVHPNRNGWSFWVESSSGKRLQAIRYEKVPGS